MILGVRLFPCLNTEDVIKLTVHAETKSLSIASQVPSGYFLFFLLHLLLIFFQGYISKYFSLRNVLK
jgi:hypothetical protein